MRRIEVEAASLDEAVRAALAELSGAEPDEVDVQLGAPGLDTDGSGEVRLTIELSDGLSAREGAEEEGAPRRDEDEPAAVEDEDTDGEEDEDEDEEGDGERGVTIDDLDEEADAAADFLEGVLDAMDLPGDLQIRVHEDHAEIEVMNVGSGRLIGRRGQTLDALQELLRCALQRQFERRARVTIDVEGYRQRRLEKFLEKAEEAIAEVQRSGEPQRLEPMDVFERKAVHQLVAEHEGVTSSSRGREPTRRVVVEPA